MHRVHHLAEHVELQLPVRRVADAHRARLLVARKPRHFPFGEAPLARDAVHHLELLRPARDRARQPVAPALRLLVIAGVHQGEQRQRRVAHPAEAVVPVAVAADPLGQRGGRRRHDAAGRAEGERLERDERAGDRVLPGAERLPAAGPLGPVAFGVPQCGVGRKRFRNAQVRGAVAQHERHAIAFADGEFADRGHVLAAQVHRRAQHHHVGAGDRAQRAVAELAHPGNDRAVAEAQDQLDAHRDAPAHALHDAHAVGMASADRHEVDQRHGAVAGFERVSRMSVSGR